MDTTIPGIGHNMPPAPDIDTLLDPSLLTEQWELDHAALLTRRDSLLERAKLFFETHPTGITTEDEAEKLSDFVSQVADVANLAKAKHVPAKAPFLAAGRAADAFFLHQIKAAVEEIVPKINGSGTRGEPLGILTAFLRAKAAREAEERAAAANALAEEAARAIAAAERTMNADVVDHAIALEEQARAAQSAANAPIGEMSRVRGSGSVSGLRDNWTFELVDLKALVAAVHAGTVPLNFLCVNATVVAAAVRPKDGLRSVPGLNIFNAQKSGTRR